MSVLSKVNKTNFGQEVNSNSNSASINEPGNIQIKETYGAIVDIRLPGEGILKEGKGVLVRIVFDDPVYSNARQWFPLVDSYESILSSVGNAESVKKSRPRVKVTFPIARFSDAYATLICDNSQEMTFKGYMRNRSNSFVSVISGLAYGTKCPG
jgi:hypothetical protein